MKIEYPVYPVNIYIYKGISHKEFSRKLKKESGGKVKDDFIEKLSGNGWDGIVHSTGCNIVVRFKDKKPKADIVAHECFHMTKCIADYVGLKLSDESEEAWAYLLDDLVNKVNEAK